MSLEHHPARDEPSRSVPLDPAARGPPDDQDYWNQLIDEKAAAQFLDVEVRTMQKWRQTGEGPRFIRLSSRCLRYTRLILKTWADGRLRRSTSDSGAEAA